MIIIVISGTPGTGKTTISKEISNIINARVISLNDLAISENLTIDYDDLRDSYIINESKIKKRLKNLIKEFQKESINYLIIESHLSDITPNKFIDYAVILRCDPDKLYNRLELRGYKKEKILENVQSEILGTCANFLINKKLGKPIIELDTTNDNFSEIAKIIVNIITGKKDYNNFRIGNVDWLERLNIDNKLSKYFN